METLYSILGADEDATADVIKKAFKQKAVEYHPDKVNNLGEKIKVIAELEFKRLNKACEVLTDKEKRKEYDELLRKGFGSASPQAGKGAEREFRAVETRTEDEYRKEISALQAMIASLNFENSNLKNRMIDERNMRISLENEIENILGDRFWMKRDLEFLINKYDEQIRFMDEQYRKIINQVLNDLVMEFQIGEEDYQDVQRRLINIQHFTYQMLGNLMARDINFDTIRRNLAHVNTRQGIFIPGVNQRPSAPGKSAINIKDSSATVEWEFEKQKGDAKKAEGETAEVRGHIILDEEDAAGPDEKGEDEVVKGTYLNECPFCGKEVGSDQTYCFYCGAVF